MPPKAMQHLLTYISGLIGVLVLFIQLWKLAPLDRALTVAVLTTLSAFLILHLGYVAIRWILTLAPPQPETDESQSQQEKKTTAPDQSRTDDEYHHMTTAAAT